MADKTGYIGRNPGDSSVTIARQTFTPTSDTTSFTFDAGYTVGLCDVYLNGAKLIDATDYDANTGTTVGLTTAAQNGDVVEIVAYKAFNLGQVSSSSGNFTVGSNLSVGSTTTLSGVTTCEGDLYVGGDLYVLDDIVYDEVSGRNLNITGVATAATIHVGSATTIDGSGVNVTGVITATSFSGDGSSLTGIAVTSDINTNNIKVSGITTLSGYVSTGSTVGAAGSIYFPDSKGINFGGQAEGDLQIFHDGSNSYIKDVGTGDLKIQGASDVVIENTSGSNIAVFNSDGSVELYWRGAGGAGKKFETTQTGAVATGIHTATVALHAGSTITADAGTGIITATQYKGDGSALTGVGGEFDITSCLFV